MACGCRFPVTPCLPSSGLPRPVGAGLLDSLSPFLWVSCGPWGRVSLTPCLPSCGSPATVWVCYFPTWTSPCRGGHGWAQGCSESRLGPQGSVCLWAPRLRVCAEPLSDATPPLQSAHLWSVATAWGFCNKHRPPSLGPHVEATSGDASTGSEPCVPPDWGSSPEPHIPARRRGERPGGLDRDASPTGHRPSGALACCPLRSPV